MISAGNIAVFFDLVKAGLWEREARLLSFGEIEFSEVLRIAEEQSVVGLVTAGLEHVTDTEVPKTDLMQFIGKSIQIEQQNIAMNNFIEMLVNKMREGGIYTLLLKGQGVAQCYERPLWRTCGDVDFLLSDNDYELAKNYLAPLASSVKTEVQYEKQNGMTIDHWLVELHGYLRSGLSRKVDKGLDDVQKGIFYGGDVRPWSNDKTQVFLPGYDSDAIYIFTHILQHFYKGGIGLRQICDWCRLLWTYRDRINIPLLQKRLEKMGLMNEWKTFGAFIVDYLGMPIEAMPFYSPASKWSKKAKLISSFIMKVGNLGHNRDWSYFEKYPYLIRKVLSFGRRIADLLGHARIFPVGSLRFFPSLMLNGIVSAARGE